MKKRLDTSLIDRIVFALFCLALGGGVALQLPTVALLAAGFALFFVRGLTKGTRFAQLAKAAGCGVWEARPVLVALVLIGALTALWRSTGTIAELITLLAPLLSPGTLPLTAFGLCALVSFLMGTAFGTAATAGVVCMAVCHASGAHELIVGGAALAGCYFGDRCSPISSSALLVSTLTKTKLADNLIAMAKSALMPTLACVAAYAALGAAFPGSGSDAPVPDYSGAFALDPLALAPTVSVLVLAVLRVDTRLNLLASCALAFALSVTLQGNAPESVLAWAIGGFSSPASAALPGMTGGGLASMANALAIIVVASTYAGLLQEAGMINSLEPLVARLARVAGPHAATTVTATAASALACNQTLAIMLTHQLMHDQFTDHRALMLALENTAVTIAALIPWSIAAAVPLASMGVGVECLPFAAFCYLMPLWEVARHTAKRKEESRAAAQTARA